MAKEKEGAAVSTFADHEVIVPPNKLKKAIVRGEPNVPVPDPVARAEAALTELSSEFSAWMEHECVRLDTTRNGVKSFGVSSTLQELFRAAHDIKGQAATFGYPLMAPVAESLCRLLEHAPDPTRIPIHLIDQHVDGIRAILHRNARGDAEAIATALATRLRQVTDEFLIFENRNRPYYLDGIAAPPLSPESA
jgi:HPt (histidine-containing phosphotransfer) domain-containing protein